MGERLFELAASARLGRRHPGIGERPWPANASYRLGEALGFRVAINDRGVYAADIARVDQGAA